MTSDTKPKCSSCKERDAMEGRKLCAGCQLRTYAMLGSVAQEPLSTDSSTTPEEA